jgi:hypothetical protein
LSENRGVLPSVLAALLTSIALLVLTGFQVTGPTAAPRLLGRLGGAMVEVDRWAPAHAEDLRLLAAERPRGTIVLDNLPVEVRLPASQVTEAGPDGLQRLVTEALGQEIYRQGDAAFLQHDGGRGLQVTEPVRWAADLLQQSTHGRWRAALLITTLFWVAAIALVLTTGRSPLPAIAIGAGIAALGAAAAWLLAGAGRGLMDGAVDQEIMLIARDGAWLGLRNSLAVMVAAVALSVGIALLGRVRPRQAAIPRPARRTRPPWLPPA